jgi:hypothetical protein
MKFVEVHIRPQPTDDDCRRTMFVVVVIKVWSVGGCLSCHSAAEWAMAGSFFS